MGQTPAKMFPQPAEVGGFANQGSDALVQAQAPMYTQPPTLNPIQTEFPTVSSPNSGPRVRRPSGPDGWFGGGGVGYGGGCFSGNTMVVIERRGERETVPYDKIKLSDMIPTRAGTIKPIKEIHIHDHDGPVFDMGNGELVTPEHPMAQGDKPFVEAQDLFQDKFWIKGNVYNITVDTELEEERNYQLGNGWWAHNKMDPR